MLKISFIEKVFLDVESAFAATLYLCPTVKVVEPFVEWRSKKKCWPIDHMTGIGGECEVHCENSKWLIKQVDLTWQDCLDLQIRRTSVLLTLR